MKNKIRTTEQNPTFFTPHNYKWMVIGLFFIFLGFALMIGDDANTINGVYNPNYWNPDIFSWRRVRLAPTIVVLGFGIQIYAILSKEKESE